MIEEEFLEKNNNKGKKPNSTLNSINRINEFRYKDQKEEGSTEENTNEIGSVDVVVVRVVFFVLIVYFSLINSVNYRFI
jgi:hypothetical protein